MPSTADNLIPTITRDLQAYVYLTGTKSPGLEALFPVHK
jgi:hypothetical protein